MLPAGGWSSANLRGELLAPRNRAWLPLKAYAIQTRNQTIMRAELDKSKQNIIIKNDGTGEIVEAVPANNPSVIDIAYDQLDRLFLTWQIDDQIYIYFYDTLTDDYDTVVIATGENPCCALDDRRDALIPNSDIMLVYQRGDFVFYRMQRDRYLIERPVPHSYISPLVRGCGMATNLRFSVRILGFLE